MSLERRQVNILSPKERNILQMQVAEKMIGHKPSDTEMLEWIGSYATKTSEIIDSANSENIREIFRAGEIEKAAEMVSQLLGSSDRRAA